MTDEELIALAKKHGWIEIYRPEIYEFRFINNTTGQRCDTVSELRLILDNEGLL